jgi:hypothetical protein
MAPNGPLPLETPVLMDEINENPVKPGHRSGFHGLRTLFA